MSSPTGPRYAPRALHAFDLIFDVVPVGVQRRVVFPTLWRRPMNKYMLIYRSPAAAAAEFQPSPEEMQAMLQQWQEWKEKFKANILDMGDGLQAGGRVLQPDNSVTDGPYVEAKEVIGGFSLIQAESYEQAIEVSRACPVRHMPGNSVEVRELAGF